MDIVLCKKNRKNGVVTEIAKPSHAARLLLNGDLTPGKVAAVESSLGISGNMPKSYRKALRRKMNPKDASRLSLLQPEVTPTPNKSNDSLTSSGDNSPKPTLLKYTKNKDS